MIIGLTGLKRSGKDTAGAYLKLTQGLPTIAYADPLKEAAIHMFGISREMAFGLDGYDRDRLVAPWGISVRELLQKLGTECGRYVFFDDFWGVRLGMTVDNDPAFSKGFIVTDVRFDDEAEGLKKRGGVIWSITRKQKGPTDTHASEQGVHPSLIDKHIPNLGSIKDLHVCLSEALNG